jgi:hypothetical protein
MSRITGAIGVSVDGDDDIKVVYTEGYRGRLYPTLRIGNSLGLDVTDASPKVLRQIAEAAEELAEWAEKRDLAAQVAAEDGVRSFSIPTQPGRVAA